MKNILLSGIASVGLSISTQAQTPTKTVFQYEQDIIAILKTAVEKNIAEENALPMPEGEKCYAFERNINSINRQVFYCEDTKKSFVSWGEKPKDVDLQERQQLLDAITQKYPTK